MSDTTTTDEKQGPRQIMADALAIALVMGADPRVTVGEATAGWVEHMIKALAEAGYVIVPREPTEAMVEAAHLAWDRDVAPGPFTLERLLRAAIAAALGEDKP